MCSSAIYERCRAIGDRNCAEHAIVLNDSVLAFDRSQQVSHLALGPLGLQRGIDVPVASLVDPFAGTPTIYMSPINGPRTSAFGVRADALAYPMECPFVAEAVEELLKKPISGEIGEHCQITEFLSY